MPPDIYSTATMLAALPSLRKAPRFLQDNVFTTQVFSDDEKIYLDKLGDDIRVAPFVSPLSPGKTTKGTGTQTDSITPAYVKPWYAIDPRAPIRRSAGEAVGGTLTPAQREAIILSQYMTEQVDQITRRVEVMGAQVIKTGALTISGEDYSPVTVDFGRDAALTVSLSGGNAWGQTGVSPYDAVDNWINLIGEKCGAAGNLVIMGKDAWAKYRADEKALKSLDRQLGQTANLNLGLTAGAPGTAVYKGNDGGTTFVVYNDTYQEVDGNNYTLFDNNGVAIIATGAAVGIQGYGAILDAELGYQAVPYLPKSWVPHNPAIRQLMTQSAPMPFFGRVNATFYAKVA